jgi:V/A-type H+/Na+-transporting ATPase subunit I
MLQLENYLNNSECNLLQEKPIPNDNPPILLKNGWFANYLSLLVRYSPCLSYKEMDLTPFFAPFFHDVLRILYGRCGIWNYSVLAGVFLRNGFQPSLKPFLTLAIFLGIGTMIFGVVTGTIAVLIWMK